MNVLLDRDFVVSKVGPCMFIYKSFIFVLYVDDCLFWERSQYDIDNLIQYLRKMGPFIIGNNQR